MAAADLLSVLTRYVTLLRHPPCDFGGRRFWSSETPPVLAIGSDGSSVVYCSGCVVGAGSGCAGDQRVTSRNWPPCLWVLPVRKPETQE